MSVTGAPGPSQKHQFTFLSIAEIEKAHISLISLSLGANIEKVHISLISLSLGAGGQSLPQQGLGISALGTPGLLDALLGNMG